MKRENLNDAKQAQIEEARARAKQADEAAKARREAKAKAPKKAFDFTYVPIGTTSKAYKIASHVWFRKTADVNLSAAYEIEREALDALYKTNAWKQAIFNLYCEQRPTLEILENYLNTTPNVVARDAARLKIDEALLTQIHEGAKRHHNAINEGAEIKVRPRRETSDITFKAGVMLACK